MVKKIVSGDKREKAVVEDKRRDHSALLFVGLLFLGLGLGLVFGEPGSGLLIGMGLGFLAMYYSRKK